MSNDIKRGLGDNQNPIEDHAIEFIERIYNALIAQQQFAEKAFAGRNKTIRDNNALMSAAKIGQTLKELEPWKIVIKAKQEGVDVHSAPIKTHKLDIVAGAEHKFGQYIIDKEDYEEKR
jgi:hypothetical protein